MPNWIRGEIIAMAGVFGAAMTVLSQLSKVLPMAPFLATALAWWETDINVLWGPVLAPLGMELHPHLYGATSAAVFMGMIGIGARISAKLQGAPVGSLKEFPLDDMSWPSLAIFAALCMTFLLGHDPAPNDTSPLIVMGSKTLGKYAFAIVVSIGYFAGEYLGRHEFHRRLYRLAALVLFVLALNFAVLRAGGW